MRPEHEPDPSAPTGNRQPRPAPPPPPDPPPADLPEALGVQVGDDIGTSESH